MPVSGLQNSKRLEKLEKDLQKLEHKYAKQKDAVHQAKQLAKLLPKGVEAAGLRIQAGQVDQGIGMLTHYRDEARQVYEALLATGRNPVKKPDGFKQLQIALRESVRHLRDVSFLVPFGRRGTVETVRSDMEQINARLLQELFPPPKPRKKKKSDKHA